MRTYKVRNDRGEEFDVDEGNIKEAEKDGFLPIVRNAESGDTQRASIDDLSMAAKDGYAPVRSGENYSKTESALRGLAQGASLGFADELTGGLEATGRALFGNDKLADFSKNYGKYRDESRQNYHDAQAENPYSYGTGELTGAVGTAFVPGLNAAKGASLATLAAKGALQGGLMGLGGSEGQDITEIAGDTAKGAGIGGIAGAASNYVGPLLERAGAAGKSLLNEIATNPYVEKLANFQPQQKLTDMFKSTVKSAAGGVDDKLSQKVGAEGVEGGAETFLRRDPFTGKEYQVLPGDESIGMALSGPKEGPRIDPFTKKPYEPPKLPPAVTDPSDDASTKLANKGIDALGNIFSRKATYGIPGLNIAQGASDSAMVARKAAQFTVDGLEKMAPYMGKYAPALQSAAQRGSQAMAATHFLLSQTDPEYRELLAQHSEVNQ